MIETKRITYLRDKKLVLLIPSGLSNQERSYFRELSPTIRKINKENEINEGFGVSQDFSEELLQDFQGFTKLMVIKNPYWRVLEIYLWNYLYRAQYGFFVTETFKKTIKRLYSQTEIGLEKENRYFVRPQNLNLTDNYFLCEDYIREYKKWFDIEITETPSQNTRMITNPPIYDLSMESVSDFYDSESAQIIYEKHQKIFEKFGYSFYSYLDFHNPVKKIHVLHGDLVNKFEI